MSEPLMLYLPLCIELRLYEGRWMGRCPELGLACGAPANYGLLDACHWFKAEVGKWVYQRAKDGTLRDVLDEAGIKLHMEPPRAITCSLPTYGFCTALVIRVPINERKEKNARNADAERPGHD